MSVSIIAVASDSGVPIFSRKRGKTENVQFSTIASLHGINMFTKCHNLALLNTHVDNGAILWKEYCKSVTLIGIATGGLECDLELLLMSVHNLMVFCVGKQELESLRNVEQIKRDIRQCYPILDLLLESLDPNTGNSPHPTLTLELMPSMLCPQASQLQQALDNYAARVTGRWACLSIHGCVVATSTDFAELDPREARLLVLLMAAQDGAPLRETLVYLPQMSPNVAFRAVTCKLLADVYVLVMCGVTPPLSQIDELVLQCWEGYAPALKEAKCVYPRNLPSNFAVEPCILGIMLVNILKHRCVYARVPNGSGHKSSGHRADVLRTFYVTAGRQLAPELSSAISNTETDVMDTLPGLCETYWCSEYHTCFAQRSGDLLCCVLFSSNVPVHTARLITAQILQDVNTNRDISW